MARHLRLFAALWFPLGPVALTWPLLHWRPAWWIGLPIYTAWALLGLLFLRVVSRWELSLYRRRKDQTQEWLRQFPNVSQAELLCFLTVFADEFGLPKNLICRIRPQDEILRCWDRKFRGLFCLVDDVDHFILDIRDGYQVDLSEGAIDAGMTMGQLLERILSQGTLSIPEARRE